MFKKHKRVIMELLYSNQAKNTKKLNKMQLLQESTRDLCKLLNSESVPLEITGVAALARHHNQVPVC